MADLSPDLGAKLGRLLPRLASDSPGEVNATVQAIRRTLDRAGLDLHDLAARLTDPPQRAQPAQREAPGSDLRAMAEALRAHALDRLTLRQRDFVKDACRLLAAGRPLSVKQAQWLRDLHALHIED
jgi:hypothetical protein